MGSEVGENCSGLGDSWQVNHLHYFLFFFAGFGVLTGSTVRKIPPVLGSTWSVEACQFLGLITRPAPRYSTQPGKLQA